MTPKAALAGRTWQALWARVLADQALAGLPTPFRTAGCVEPGKIASIIDRCIIFAVRPEQSSHEASGKVMYRLVAEIGKHEYLCALAREGASALVQPWSTGFDRIVERDQNLVEDWLDRILATAENQSLRQIHNLGVCLAAAYAARDGTKAAAVLRHLRHSIPVILILVGKERMSLYNYALFGAAETSVLNPLREDVFAGAFDDAALDAAVIAAESCGAGPWLDRYVERLLASSHPGDLARGLTVLGLRHFDDQSDRNLATFAGPGFLGQVTAAATKNSGRARWAQHWIERASNASNPIDFWRFGKLAEGVADWRFAREFDNVRTGALLDRFGDELCARLQKAAEARTEKRKKTPFGLKVPDQDLLRVLRLDHPCANTVTR